MIARLADLADRFLNWVAPRATGRLDSLVDLTDNDPHFDKVCELGQLTPHWPTTELPAEWPSRLDEHEVPALELFRLALLTPDSELLPAEEAQR